jgi:ribosomal-protein-alanine N-acetyltransferase
VTPGTPPAGPTSLPAAVHGAVTLRRATHADVAAVAALEAVAFGDPWSAESFASLVHNPAVLFLVATATGDATLAGYLVAWFAADQAEIANLAVAPAQRGRGVGARLLDGALAEGERRGTVACFLEVRASNVAAQRLYASRAFAAVGRRPRYYRNPTEDALVLRCEMHAARAAAVAREATRAAEAPPPRS